MAQVGKADPVPPHPAPAVSTTAAYTAAVYISTVQKGLAP